ncbi:zinc metalloprotease Rip1 [bacterium BMS3Abin01]|nr:zinc metalloprotease Rip1 [bacterium BMS3Abin01]HDY69463.1 PDZ domain-containing protein [Actinomycetota bacterium]
MFIAIAILGIGFLIFVHELGHFLAAKAFGMRAEKFYIGFPPAALKRKFGETEYGIGVIPLGGYVKISGMTREEKVPEDLKSGAFYSKPVWKRIIVVSAGAAMNLLLAFILFFVFYWQAVPEYENTNTIALVQADSGAEHAGLQVGDKLLGVDGSVSDDPQVIRDELQSRPDQQATLLVERDGKQQQVTADIGRQAETGGGILGVAFKAVRVGTMDISAPQAARHAALDIPLITKEVFLFIGNIFSREGIEDISTPIGIVAFSSETIKMGWGVFVRMLGFISLQLAILNLLPLLPLDGGHVVFNLAESIKGSPVRRQTYERVSAIGITFFIILFMIALMNDIQRLLGPGFKLEP